MISHIIWAWSTAVDSLMSDGKFMEAVVQIWREAIGVNLVTGFALFGIGVYTAIRFQSILPVVIVFGLVLANSIRLWVPTEMLALVVTIISLAVGGLMYLLFWRTRR